MYTAPLKDTVHNGVRISAAWIDTSSSGISLAICPESVRKNCSIDKVLAYENKDVLARIQHDLGLTAEDAGLLYQDLLRFLWLAAVTPPHTVPTPSIDEAWHCFVLYTKDYADFCEAHFGGFLHHAPQRLGETRLAHSDLHSTIDAMEREFGGLPSPNWHYTANEQAA